MKKLDLSRRGFLKVGAATTAAAAAVPSVLKAMETEAWRQGLQPRHEG